MPGAHGRPLRTRSRLWPILIVVALVMACSDSEPPSQQSAILIRSGDRTVTLAQFERAFAAARIAYSDNRSVSPALIRDARLRLLHQMTEEVIVARRAAELGITVDDAELAAAVKEIKADYPEGEFAQMLLESAIPYALWQERLRSRLLMEKVVQKDLIDPLTISTDEIEAYYQKNKDAFSVDEQQTVPDELKRGIVEQLRREKVEAAWPAWMENLKTRYGVEINWVLWEQAQQPDDAKSRQEEENGS